MSAPPTDLVAVFGLTHKRWCLYYVEDGGIEWFQGPKDEELEDAANPLNYEDGGLDFSKVEGSPPKPKKGNSQLGVLEWVDSKGNPQTRVYYLDDKNNLVEVCWSGGRKSPNAWYNGSLTTARFKASDHSPITTAITNDQHKVYYRAEDDDGCGQLWVAYKAIGQDGWLHRSVMDF